MRFDYYSATVPADPGTLVTVLQADLAGLIDKVERQKGLNNYDHAEVCRDPLGQPVCSVLHGGSNGAPHVKASGLFSPDVADVLRNRFPNHRVSRADVAIDFDGAGTWDKLYAVCFKVAEDKGLKWTTYGDFRDQRDPLQGRTVYIGSRKSAVLVRLYEKGKKILSETRVGEDPPSLDWCRLEVEVKPLNRPTRELAATMEPIQFWGFSRWARILLHEADGADVERVTMRVHRETNAMRSVRHMAVQYRNAMEEARDQIGRGDQGLIDFIRQVWNQMDGTDYPGRTIEVPAYLPPSAQTH